MMADVKLPRTDLLALVFSAASTLAVVALGIPMTSAGPLSEQRAKSEAATYLTSQPQHAELEASQWKVSDGKETAWIDARTGELVEIEFAAR
jgi:hypothetical protein